MWSILVLRDSVLFILGIALIVRELLSHHPNVEIITVAASLTGVPGWLHALHIRRTAIGQNSSVSTPATPDQSSPPSNSSESEG